MVTVTEVATMGGCTGALQRRCSGSKNGDAVVVIVDAKNMQTILAHVFKELLYLLKGMLIINQSFLKMISLCAGFI